MPAGPPAEVLAVCVPWPFESRALLGKTSPPKIALYVARNGCPEMSLRWQANTSAAGVSGLSPKLQVRGVPSALGGGAGRFPWSAKEGCSGQAPLSRMPTIVPRPAVLAGSGSCA